MKKQILFALLIFSLCSGFSFGFPDTLRQNRKIKVMTSVFPLREFAGAVGGENTEVGLLLPPGASVHTWQPRPSDIMRLSAADLFIYVGAGLEPWIPGLLKSLPAGKLKVLVVADFLPLEKEDEGGREGADPHVWLDFGLDRTIVDRIAATLEHIDPGHASGYKESAARYNEKLERLDRLFSQGLSHCRHRTILLGGHAAFGYLARRYGLGQVSLSGLSPDAEPAPSRLIEIVAWARDRNIRTVFVEANASPRMAKVLAREIPAALLTLNPGANLNKKEWDSGVTFIDIMEENLENLKKGLICD
jgi:zinc transport system substrate-binding protein